MEINKLVGISALVVALSLAYFLVVYIPQRDEKIQLMQRRERHLEESRKECDQEVQEKFDSVDSVVKSDPNITPEQAQNLARRAGITDENNFVIDKDILIRNCVERKQQPVVKINTK